MLRIHLLGRPYVERDGVRLPPPRGRKAWALLAYLACTKGAHSRDRLASLLFADADDPLGALRWNLVEVRRLVGDLSCLKGEQLSLELPPGSLVDVVAIAQGSWVEALDLPGLGGELLEGLSFPSSVAYESWLLNERRHQQAVAEATIREAALARLGMGDTESAIDLAARLVALAPFEEPYQELLIRSYAVAGDRQSAHRQLAACIELLRRELGVEPGEAVFAAADAPEGGTRGRSIVGPATVRAQLEAGRAAIDAGVIDAGIECLRRAVADAQICGDAPLQAEALVALGSALVHMVRSRDEEGAAVLHEAIAIAERTGQRDVLSLASLELAWIEVLTGRYERALAQLERAAATATGDDLEQSTLALMMGGTYLEMGRYATARPYLERSVALAENTSRRALALSLSELARMQLMIGDLASSRETFLHAVRLAREERLNSVLPMMEGVFGILELMNGAPAESVAETLEHGFAFSCQIGDPCAESATEHGLGLLFESRGEIDRAIVALDDARHRCVRRGDASVWFQAWALDSLCRVAIDAGHEHARRWVADLETLAGRTGMNDFLVRAFLHRARLGDANAIEAARTIAASVESPALHERIEAAAAARTN